MSRLSHRYTASLALASALTAAGAALPAVAEEVELRIVNITRGQVFSPVIAWSHERDFEPFFELGEPASEELREIAENGNIGPMEDLLEGDGEVRDIAIGSGPIPPGGEAVLTLDIDRRASRISLASMLVNTNDTFFALNGVATAKAGVEAFSPGMDAGTEANNENCQFIPGPACGDTPNQTAEDGAEGFIFIQEGIHGVNGGVATSELDPAQQDWRNPVAYVEIKFMR